MDILAHTLWTNAAARAGNKKAIQKNGRFRVHVGWTAFWGVFPDFFAFTIPFIVGIIRLVSRSTTRAELLVTNASSGGFDLASYLYQYSHSLVVWAAVFLLVWIIARRPRYELLGWALHILIDIPSHAITFFPTPFLFPISDYRFPYGVAWSNMWYMIINYTALGVVWGRIVYKKLKQKKASKQSQS